MFPKSVAAALPSWESVAHAGHAAVRVHANGTHVPAAMGVYEELLGEHAVAVDKHGLGVQEKKKSSMNMQEADARVFPQPTESCPRTSTEANSSSMSTNSNSTQQWIFLAWRMRVERGHVRRRGNLTLKYVYLLPV
jgi:hypothetical protein